MGRDAGGLGSFMALHRPLPSKVQHYYTISLIDLTLGGPSVNSG